MQGGKPLQGNPTKKRVSPYQRKAYILTGRPLKHQQWTHKHLQTIKFSFNLQSLFHAPPLSSRKVYITLNRRKRFPSSELLLFSDWNANTNFTRGSRVKPEEIGKVSESGPAGGVDKYRTGLLSTTYPYENAGGSPVGSVPPGWYQCLVLKECVCLAAICWHVRKSASGACADLWWPPPCVFLCCHGNALQLSNIVQQCWTFTSDELFPYLFIFFQDGTRVMAPSYWVGDFHNDGWRLKGLSLLGDMIFPQHYVMCSLQILIKDS